MGLGIRRRDPESKRVQLVASCILFVAISVPLILHLVPPNGMYGFRTPATRSSPAIWYPANAFAGWTLLVASVASGILLLRLPVPVKRWQLWAAFLGPILAGVGLSFVYLDYLMR